MKLKAKLINYAVAKAKQNKFLKSIIEKPIDLKKHSVKGTFADSHGNSFPLYDQFRSKVKPNWQSYFANVPTQLPSNQKIITNAIDTSRLQVERIEQLIETYVGGIKGKTVLEIGCHSGGVLYTFAQKGALKVTGTDYVEYKVSSADSKNIEKANAEVNQSLSNLRTDMSKMFSNTNVVDYRNDDICNSQLPHSFYDIACSWDVLEHIHDPESAFKHIYNILKPGGISIHEYNPFFGLNGGHSPCTIDFPWGHVALNDKDFEKFCDEIQPERKEKALSFYYKGLNRMTIADMKSYVKKSGLELVAFLPYTKEQHVYLINKQTVTQAIHNYPTATIEDLLTPRVVIVLKRPA